MTTPLLSGRPVTPKTEKEKSKRAALNEAPPIPPELLLRRDDYVRYERGGPVYATDGKVGSLRRVVVDESAGEVTELVVATEGSDALVIIPPDIVDRSAGSAVFLTINRVQFAERLENGTPYVKNHFSRADLKGVLKREGRSSTPRRSVTGAGDDFVETPTISPLDRLQPRPEATAAD